MYVCMCMCVCSVNIYSSSKREKSNDILHNSTYIHICDEAIELMLGTLFILLS